MRGTSRRNRVVTLQRGGPLAVTFRRGRVGEGSGGPAAFGSVEAAFGGVEELEQLVAD
jgi:hypothetical protein